MPRTPDQNQALRDESQRRLLDAARRTFVRLGVDRATIRDIAQEAAVSQGLLYNYFRSKDELVRAVFQLGARDVAAALGARPSDGTPAEQLEAVIRRSFEIVREHREFWLLSYMLRFQLGAATVAAELPAWMESVRIPFEKLLRKIGHPDAVALSYVLFATIDGVSQHLALSPDAYPLESVVASVVKKFCAPPASPTRTARRASRTSR